MSAAHLTFDILPQGQRILTACHAYVYQVWYWQLKPFYFYSTDMHKQTKPQIDWVNVPHDTKQVILVTLFPAISWLVLRKQNQNLEKLRLVLKKRTLM